MLRSIFVAGALFIGAPALACGGSANCASSHCQMKSADETAAAAEAVESADGTQLVLNVAGMKCGACSDKVTAALKAVDGVNEAAVDHAAGTATVAYDASKVETTKLIEAVTALGFEATVPESDT